MDIESLRYVVTLADELHFGRAAQQHFVTAGHFGRRVQRLERALGARLFDRTSRHVELTSVGQRVVSHARAVLLALDELRASADPLLRTEAGVLRVGVLGFGMAERWPLLRDLVGAAMPGIKLVYEDVDLYSQYDAVRRGDVDVAVVHYLGDLDGLLFQPVYTTPRVAIVPASSPFADADRLCLNDVADEGWVRVSGGHPRLAEWAGPAQQVPRGSPLVRTPSAVPGAVATTGLLGVHGAAASRYFARPDVRFVLLDGTPAEVAVATRRSDNRPIVQAFRQAVAALDHDPSGT
ncbi:LysR family transcriptional regulator [Nocardia sp. NBC_01009]|uniref:LysR family transcriptional regulator n=1 Tax=Nocardia sp. NBC_01009 TaxID=2975996 RepID=UPI00386765EF|nr:LysR family transcriptional regulator [Nocardia sp. NBC_01009]